MKAQELRIGNWVNSYDHNSEPHQVDADDIAYCATKVGSGHFEPIPLTEDWLIKFGFEREGDLNYTRYRHKNPDALFSFGNYARSKDDPESKPTLKTSCKDGQTNQVSIQDLKYVHQLQNLHFALTGEELKPV